MPRNHSRRSLLALWFLLLWSANGSQVNITIDDFDPSIAYAPTNSWNSSNVVCSACNNPPVLLASQQTYHKGIHVVSLLDADDAPPTRSSAGGSQSISSPDDPPSTGNTSPPLSTAKKPSPSQPSTALPSPPPPSSPPPSQPSSPPPDGGGDHKGGGGSNSGSSPNGSGSPNGNGSPHGSGSSPNGNGSPNGSGSSHHDERNFNANNDNDDDKSSENPGRRDVLLPRLDPDDPGFVDTPVFAQYNFTGIAVYVFCIQPLGVSPSAVIPSLMNVTFAVDNVPEPPFVHQGLSSGSGFASDVNVFAKQGLTDGPHVLKLNLAPNSVFILDYILVTQNVADAQTSTPNAPIQSQLSNTSSENGTTEKGRASFAGALAGSLGILGTLSFGTAFSIYRRRRLAARRERLERGNAPPPAPMSGPAPFIPRYFPGTVVPSIPPPYAPSDTSSASNSAAASEPLLATHPEQTYADIPPPMDDIAPPSFGVAITTPAVTLLSSSDVASPPPRPLSWGADPSMIPLPPSTASESHTTSIFSADDDQV